MVSLYDTYKLRELGVVVSNMVNKGMVFMTAHTFKGPSCHSLYVVSVQYDGNCFLKVLYCRLKILRKVILHLSVVISYAIAKTTIGLNKQTGNKLCIF